MLSITYSKTDLITLLLHPERHANPKESSNSSWTQLSTSYPKLGEFEALTADYPKFLTQRISVYESWVMVERCVYPPWERCVQHF